MEKILVTGGCGYIGSHTIVDLIANGFEVICFGNLQHLLVDFCFNIYTEFFGLLFK